MDLRSLTADVFEPLLGHTFTLRLPSADLPLELRGVRRLGAPPGDDARTPFSLQFAGPPEPLLAQRIYPLEHGELGSVELFLVPLGPIAGALLYEAVFT